MGHDFVVLDLVCNPTLLTAETIDWANGVLNTYADRKAIVVTHGYIKADGTLAGGDWVAGPTIRNNIVTNHQNVIAVCADTSKASTTAPILAMPATLSTTY